METVLHLEAVRAATEDPIMARLLYTATPRELLAAVSNPPDWVLAGLNCANDADILPVALHTFLMDWRPPK